ncbi:hypothetical protein Zmor_024493 [Zophobas morio]|uniref:Tudor domain-containing protein n=1 Tax=Zophobas morio TaxID=2755281 RepID=A0AA38I0C0_9CUCU|nr:hypothetical protein Zmor_024493 [Zophobas morio]
MIAVLQNHIKVLHTYENVSKTVSSELSQLEQNAQPEKENSHLNPFIFSPWIPAANRISTRDNIHVRAFLEVDEIHPNSSTRKQYENVVIKKEHSAEGTSTKDNTEVEVLPEIDDNCQAAITNQEKIRFDSFVNELSGTGDASDATDISSDTIVDEKNINYAENGFKSENYESEGATSSTKRQEISLSEVSDEETPSPKASQFKPKKRVSFNFEPPQTDWRPQASKLFENRQLKLDLKRIGSTVLLLDHKGKHQDECGSFVIEEDDLNVGQRCLFSHIESPSEFYVCRNQTLLESFEEHINEMLNKRWHNILNKFKSKVEARKQLGDFCFGFLSTTRKWYRVEVLNWMHEEREKIFIQLIDYGEKLFYSYTNLKGINDFLYSMFPKLAIRCHLAGIYSPHPLKMLWPQRSIDFFVKLSEMHRRTEFEVIFVHRERKSFGIDLRKAADPDADSLGEELVRNGYAFEERLSEEDFLKTLKEKDLEDCENSYISDDAEEASPEDKGVDTTKMVLPFAGEVIEIIITGYISDTCHFYARIQRNFSKIESLSDTFLLLVEAMNVVQEYQAFTVLPGIGELVLVKDDTEWCRGRCVKCVNVDEVEVFLVDFGYTIVRPLGDLRRMKEAFLNIPFQAVECRLSNCKEKNDVSKDISLSFFNSLMKMKTFKACVVMSTTNVMTLEMWDTDNVEMSRVLKTFGLGEDK